MKHDFSLAVRDHFLAVAATEHRLEQEQAFRFHAERLKDREEKEEAEAKAAEEIVQEIVINGALDPDRVATLSGRIDTHQQALILALLENQEALDRVQEDIDAMLDKAHVLEDGRRVFKTRDGKQVFDETGQEVEMDADLIADHNPRWEKFNASLTQRTNLMTDREEMLEYQQKLDEAQEGLENGTLTSDDLDDLESLMDGAPSGMRDHLPAQKLSQNHAMKEMDTIPDQSVSISPNIEMGAQTTL